MSKHYAWDQLPTAYPALFSTVETPSFECGAGWIGIVSLLCQRLMTIKEENPSAEITIDRVKEKFGMLRIHFRTPGMSAALRNEILESVQLACHASSQCCERCGALGKSYFGPPNRVRCDACLDL